MRWEPRQVANLEGVMAFRPHLLAFVGLLMAPLGLKGQSAELELLRWGMGISLAAGVPLGEFAGRVNTAWGGEWMFSLALDPRGVVSLKTGSGVLLYGRESTELCIEEVGCRVTFNLVTSNSIFYHVVGPQLAHPTSWGGPYLEGFAGLAVFVTTSFLDGEGDTADLFRTDHLSDATFVWGLGGGLDWKPRKEPTSVRLRLGVQYRRHGVMEYLTPGSVRVNQDGTFAAEPVRSQANQLSVQLGFWVRLARQRGSRAR